MRNILFLLVFVCISTSTMSQRRKSTVTPTEIDIPHSTTAGIKKKDSTEIRHGKQLRYQSYLLSTEILTTNGTSITIESQWSFVDSTRVSPLDFNGFTSIIGVGDIMMGTNYPGTAFLPPNNGKSLFTDVRSVLQSADLTFGNLEGVVGDEGGTPKNCGNPKNCYTFRMPTQYMDLLLEAGFDMVSTANNHVNDFGFSGRQMTIKTLDEKSIPFAGFPERESVIVERNGISYGMAAFAPHRGTVNMKDYERAKEIIQELDKKVDIVIVSFHSGAEGSSAQHVTKKDEVFLGHNRGNVYEFARVMIDAGADIIFGHGPHVTRAVDVYKDRFIAYSMGNFCTYRKFNLSGVNGYAPIIKVFTDKQGRFHYADVISVRQPRPGGPVIDENERAFELIKQLTQSDLPEAELEFKSGRILSK